MLDVSDKELYTRPYLYSCPTIRQPFSTDSAHGYLHRSLTKPYITLTDDSFPATEFRRHSSNQKSTCISKISGNHLVAQPSLSCTIVSVPIEREAAQPIIHFRSVSRTTSNSFRHLFSLSKKPTRYFTCRVFHTLVLSFVFLLANLADVTAFPTKPGLSRTLVTTSPFRQLSIDTLDTSKTKTNATDGLFTSPDLELSMHANYTNSDRPFLKLFMRSERKRRSLEYYMSKARTPLTLISKALNPKFRLHVTDAGEVHLFTHSKNTSFLSISVIVERQEGLKMKELLERLKPKDNSRIILRRFGTNVCICMNQGGQVITERLIDDTVSDNCEWRMRSSRYGLGFQRVFEDEDILDDGSDTRMPANNLIATLSADPTASIASGWSYRLWQPEATWEVRVEKYIKLQRDMVSNVTEVRNNMSNSMTYPYSFPLLSDTKPEKEMDERTSMRVGEREVYSLEILPQDIDSLYRESQQMYCKKIELKLRDIVKHEISASIFVLNELYVSLSKLQARLKTNPSPFKSKPMARLLDEWLLLTYYRWQLKVQRQVIAQPKVAYPCSLSFQNPYLKVSNKGDLAKATILEKQEFASVYRGMLFNLYHLASWTVAQRRNWIARPRLTTLFSYLNLSIPSVAQLRQASFILNRYVSQGKMYYFSDDTTKRKLAQMLRSKTQLERVVERSVLLKYEELRFWPLIQQRTGKKYESSLIRTDDLRAEILQLPNELYCAKEFLQEWQEQRERESPSSCVHSHPSRHQLSWHTNHPRSNAIHLYKTHPET